MRKLAVLTLGVLLLAGCGNDGGGQGFELYEVTPSGAPGPERTDIVMEGLPEIPRHVVRSAPTAAAAAAVLPYAARPDASVAALEAEGTWLRVVDAGGPVWLVAEAGSGGAPDAGRLSGEVVRRSGCLVAGRPAIVGRAVVFPLDCS